MAALLPSSTPPRWLRLRATLVSNSATAESETPVQVAGVWGVS